MMKSRGRPPVVSEVQCVVAKTLLIMSLGMGLRPNSWHACSAPNNLTTLTGHILPHIETEPTVLVVPPAGATP